MSAYNKPLFAGTGLTLSSRFEVIFVKHRAGACSRLMPEEINQSRRGKIHQISAGVEESHYAICVSNADSRNCCHMRKMKNKMASEARKIRRQNIFAIKIRREQAPALHLNG